MAHHDDSSDFSYKTRQCAAPNCYQDDGDSFGGVCELCRKFFCGRHPSYVQKNKGHSVCVGCLNEAKRFDLCNAFRCYEEQVRTCDCCSGGMCEKHSADTGPNVWLCSDCRTCMVEDCTNKERYVVCRHCDKAVCRTHSHMMVHNTKAYTHYCVKCCFELRLQLVVG